MTRRGPYNGDPSFDEEESSGVTSLAPVPVKAVRLSGLDDNDRTQYFSVGALVERGKAVAAREQERAALEQTPSVTPPATTEPTAVGDRPKPGIVQQVREASFARKASALLLPLLILLLVFKPVFKKPKAAVNATAAASSAAAPGRAASNPVGAPLEVAPVTPKLAATPPEPPPTLPRGTSMEKAAVDAVAAGDFRRALSFYRELARLEPARPAYAHAVTILERRLQAEAP